MNIIELHSEAWRQLQARRGKLPHALLLCGQRGIGKFDLARRFVAGMLCERPTPSGEPCCECNACNWLGQGNHPDFRLLQPEALAVEEAGEADEGGKKKPSQQITIDQVRDLDDFLHVGTHRSGLRIVVVNPAEAMNRATANSLLKSLEEPRPDTLFVLVSSEPDRLLPTIRSRCQTVALPVPSRQRAIVWVEEARVAEADRWLALAGGAPLAAIDLARRGRSGGVAELIAQLGRGGAVEPLAAAAAVDAALKREKGSVSLKLLVEWLQKWLVDLALAKQRMPVRYFLAEADAVARLAAGVKEQKLFAFNQTASKYKAQSEQPLNSRLFLEQMFIAYGSLFGGQ